MQRIVLIFILFCPLLEAQETDLMLSTAIQSENGALKHYWRSAAGIAGDQSTLGMLIPGNHAGCPGVVVTGSVPGDTTNLGHITDAEYLEIQGSKALTNVLGHPLEKFRNIKYVLVSAYRIEPETLRRLLDMLPAVEGVGIDLTELVAPGVMQVLADYKRIRQLSLSVAPEQGAEASEHLAKVLLKLVRLEVLDLSRLDMSFWTADFALQLSQLTYLNLHAPSRVDIEEFWGTVKFFNRLTFLGVTGTGVPAPLEALKHLGDLPALEGLSVEIDKNAPAPYCRQLAGLSKVRHLDIGGNKGEAWDDAIGHLAKLDLVTLNCHEFSPAIERLVQGEQNLIALRLTVMDDPDRVGDMSSLFKLKKLRILRVDSVASAPPDIGDVLGLGSNLEELYLGGANYGAAFDAAIGICKKLRVLMFGPRHQSDETSWTIYSRLENLQILSMPLQNYSKGAIRSLTHLVGLADPTGKPWSDDLLRQVATLEKLRYIGRYKLSNAEWARLSEKAAHEMESFSLQ